MIETNSISISRPVEYVFDMVTDPTRAHEWAEFTRSVEILSRGKWGGFDQARWIWVREGLEIESIETVLRYERPTLFASKTQITRTTRKYFEKPANGPPPISQIDYPDESVVEKHFDNDKSTVLLQLDFTSTGANSMTLKLTTDSHLGWMPLIILWVRKLLRIRPHKKSLNAIKVAAEKDTDDGLD